MAVTSVGSSAWVPGTAAVTPTNPTGLTIGDYVVIDLVAKYDTATLGGAPSGWDDLITAVNAGYTAGNDNGNLRTRAFGKIWQAGDAMPSLSPSSNNVSAVRATAYRSATGGYSIAAGGEADNTPGAALAGTFSVSATVGDYIHLSGHLNGDIATMAATPTITGAGVTFGTISQNGSGSTALGTDLRYAGAHTTVSAGSNSIFNVSWALSGTTTNSGGTLHMVRIREAAGPPAVTEFSGWGVPI